MLESRGPSSPGSDEHRNSSWIDHCSTISAVSMAVAQKTAGAGDLEATADNPGETV